ncbi:MAG: hypothetical protein LM600_07530 [Thaumarchaeota archaeon]|nr:hypothetical protein [Nitrososphaerota archaeon]
MSDELERVERELSEVWSVETVLRVKHGVKSHKIVNTLLSMCFPNRLLTVIDLTYGVGRFYRIARSRIKLLIGVDIVRYAWEIKPDLFYQMPCQMFVDKVLRNEIVLPGSVDLVVIDPPWSHEKRGVFPKKIGISNMPYHLEFVNSRSIINAATRLAKHLNTLLLYRYKEPLSCEHVIKLEAEVRIMHNTGVVHYGICIPGVKVESTWSELRGRVTSCPTGAW